MQKSHGMQKKKKILLPFSKYRGLILQWVIRTCFILSSKFWLKCERNYELLGGLPKE